MAEPRASWTVLEDASSQAGLPIHKVLQDDTLANKNAIPALGFKNSLGKLRYPLVDGADRLVIATDADDTAKLSERGELLAGSATSALVTGAVIDLVADLEYKTIGAVVSCFRDAHFQIVQVDDTTETILADILVDAGQPTVPMQLEGLSFTAGSTGTQQLKIMGKNMNALSALRGTISVIEVQAAPVPV